MIIAKMECFFLGVVKCIHELRQFKACNSISHALFCCKAMQGILVSVLLASVCINLGLANVSINGPNVASAFVLEHSNIGTVVTDFHATESNGGSITWSLSATDQFSISADGVVTVASTDIDREALPSPHAIALTVTATSGSESASVMLSVTVQDINDNPPVFENTNTNSDTLELSEDVSPNTVIYTAIASDPDHGAGGNHHFLITNPDGYFSIGYFTGDITLTKALSYQLNTQHIITITIEDEGVPMLSTVVTITVTVEDTSEPGPLPDQKFYYAYLDEGTYTSSTSPTLATVSSTPGSSNGVVKYTVIDAGQDWIGQFSVGLTSGAITIDGLFDREAQSRYIVGIQLTEYLSDSVTLADAPTASTTLVLTISDINDHSPQFYSGAYTGFVNENAEEGHIVISTVNAFDGDTGDNAVFQYKIQSRSPDFEFQIDPLTGVINVTGDLDYESGTTEYSFTILAFETETATPMTGSSLVTIYVQDVNDHIPSILQLEYDYTVEENTLFSFTPTISASDGDTSTSFNTISFEINGIGTQLPFDHFQITEVSTNTVQLSNTVMLDKESIDHYHMIVKVQDNGTPPSSSTADIYVTVTDVNDFPPQFDADSYSVTIDEETTYTTCVTVAAEDTGDIDSINTAITYSLSVTSASTNTSITGLQNKFTIDSTTGVITCNPINHEYNYNTIVLSVVATDSGTNPGPLTDTATVTITVQNLNEHPPIFSDGSYSISIFEDHAVGAGIGVTVQATQGGSDNSDSSVITYSIVEGNTNGAFSIDETTGAMTLASQLGINYEELTPNPIIVKVEALDTADSLGTEYSATTTVTVTVKDVNEFAPEITAPLGNPTYTVSEGETSLPYTITTATATDADGTSNSITYSISTPTYGSFEIGSSTGILTMTVPPDRESITASDDSFIITVTATDAGSTPKSSSVTITITVEDFNDNAPVFDQMTYTVSPIPENTGGAVSLLTINAQDDEDIGINADITYSIESISPQKGGVVKFQLDSTTGVLQTGPAGFDYEDSTDRMYTIVMVAQDGGTPAQSASATATVTITDINDNPPELCEQHLEYTIDEFSGATLSSSNVIILTNLSCVTDIDSTTFKYRIVDTSKTNGWFDVDTNNGNVYIPTGTNIDREHTDNVIDQFGRAVFVFEIEITDSSFVSGDYFHDEAEVTVNVRDINDKAPVFSETSIDRTLPEGVPIGTIVDIVTATDEDSKTNAIITYSKSSGDTDGLFSVSSDGRISTDKEIDKEMIDSDVTFVITATDNGGLTDTINVKVTITDTNDNSPVFNPTFYQANIFENVAENTLAAVVDASDNDPGVNGEVTYEITGGNVDGAFKISDSSKGDIRVAGSIDRETLSFYRLVVVAKDGATGSFQRTAVAEVAITIDDVNDNVPIFLHQTHEASVAEDVSNNTIVAVSPSVYATDNDIGSNADIIYDIESGFPFTINKQDGFVYTSYVSVLDRETTDFYNITVYARDAGGLETSGILLIKVTDVNDHSPVIDQSSADLDKTISEYYSAGGLIGTVTATDADIGVNRVLRYSLTGGEGYFQVDPNYGNVTLSQTISNLERRTPFSVVVTVTDSGLPAKQDKVSFSVHVTDENDNAPVLKHDPLEYMYPEDTDISSPLLLPVDPALTANGVVEDADDGVNQQYSFMLGTSSSPAFDIDAQTGSLYFTQSMDYETQSSYTGSIYVVDKGSPSLTSENIVSISLTVTDVNDLPPVFEAEVFATNVSEYTNANVPLLLVIATDMDTLDANTEISYSITGSTPVTGLDHFKINSDTGLILTNDYLDDSTKGCYDLNIEASNPGTILKDTAEARICITDQNESPDFDQSFYNFTIYENEAANYELGYITATDPDSDPNFVSLTYTLVTTTEDDGLFTINSTTGLLTTLAQLDREDTDLHVLSVIVQDQGNNNFQHTNYTTILVNVLDINDNSPQLVHSTFNTHYVISENISRNSTIANVQATDMDLNTINNYRITDDPKTLFKIDHQTGLLQTEGGPDAFDRESFSTYNITFEVYNVDDETNSDEATITFTLTDVNDNTPYFTTIPNDTCLYENSPNGFDLGTFVAGDNDLDINARVFYQIVDGNTAQAFTIEALTGKLKTQNPLDYEVDPLEYTLTIEVQDLGIPPLSTSVQMTICVLDTNDNSPTFVNPVTEPVVIEEHTEQDYIIASFTTTDIDSYPFNQTQLSLISGNDEGAFRFNNSQGILSVNNPSILDYETGPLTHTLIIQAMDIEDPTKTVTTTVTVIITDINDHPPLFDKALFNFTLPENEAIDTLLGQVKASDVDTKTEMLTYQLVSGNEDGKFSLNGISGALSLVQSLDYETPPNYYFLTINVTDGDFFDQAFFHLYVTNVNDVPPVIDQPPTPLQVLYIPEDTPVGYDVYAVEASDIEGGDLTFTFANGQLEMGVATINETSGLITLTSALDFEADVSYEFNVFVKDNGVPPLQDSIHFQVVVTDVNDHFPEFNITDTTVRIYENHAQGIESSFLTLKGRDVDVSDITAGNLYYHIVWDTGYLVGDTCTGDIFCLQKSTGKLYHNRHLDRETFSSHTVTVAISNNEFPPTDVLVKDLGLNTLDLKIEVLDVNDNTPQFISSTQLIAIPDNVKLQSIVYICQTEDKDSFENYDRVWYRLLTTNVPFVLDKTSCVMTIVGIFDDKSGENHQLEIEAYDNEGENPSNSNQETLSVYIYNGDANEVYLTFHNTSILYVENNINTITEQIMNTTGMSVVVTDIRHTVEQPSGRLDRNSVDIVFVVIGDDGVQDNTDIIKLFSNTTYFILNNTSNTSISISIPDVRDASEDATPLWVIIIIIVILSAIIYILCCVLCAFLIVEKKRKRKLKEEHLYSSDEFSAVSTKEFSATKNPLWVSPVILPPKVDLDEVSIDESIERPNPVYEEQEINIDMFDGLSDDTFSVGSREELLPPPLSTSSLTTLESTDRLLLPPPPRKSAMKAPKASSIPPPSKEPPPPIAVTNPLWTTPPQPKQHSTQDSAVPLKLKPFTDFSPTFSSDEDDDEDPAMIDPGYVPAPPTFAKLPTPSQPPPRVPVIEPKKKQSNPPKEQAITPKMSAQGDEVTVDFMDEYDDEDPPSSSDEEERGNGNRYSTISKMEEDDSNAYEII